MLVNKQGAWPHSGTKRFFQKLVVCTAARGARLRLPLKMRGARGQSGNGKDMLRSSIFRIVDFSTRRAWCVIVCGLVLATISTIYAAQHFAVKTDVTDLFPRDLPWT